MQAITSNSAQHIFAEYERLEGAVHSIGSAFSLHARGIVPEYMGNRGLYYEGFTFLKHKEKTAELEIEFVSYGGGQEEFFIALPIAFLDFTTELDAEMIKFCDARRNEIAAKKLAKQTAGWFEPSI